MATINANSPDVNDVFNALQQCSPGDTLAIPAGRSSWTAGITVTIPITIQGAGLDQTFITDSIASRTTPLMTFTGSGGLTRLTALTFQNDPFVSGTNFNGIVKMAATPFRIDNIHFLNTVAVGVYCLGLKGVIDHCDFDTFGQQGVQIYGYNYGGQSYGDGSWADDDHLGTDNFVFIENCTWENPNFASAIDGYAGARIVFRYNTVTNGFLTVHGTDSSRRSRGTRVFEVYNNKITFDASAPNGPRPWGFLMRSGTGVIYNNDFSGTGFSFFNGVDALGASNYRNTTNSEGYPWPPWGPCCQTTPGQVCSPWDGNTDMTTGYPCLDQVGRGKGDLVTDSSPGNGNPINTTTGTPAWPNQVLDPVYQWANTINGSITAVMAGNTNNFTGGDGRDWINGVQKPGYTPFTYPHPLVQGGGSPTPPPPPTIIINPSPPSPVQPPPTTPTRFVSPPAAVAIPQVVHLPIVPSCTPAVACPGSDSPIINASAEGPDQFVFIGQNFGPYLPPPVDNLFTDQGCLGQCTSTISQQDADLCAARQAAFCVNTNNPNNPNPPPPLICNTPQSATVFCPDGLPFTYMVPAGLFCGDSQTLVNQEAQSYAQRLASAQKICLGGLQRCTCINQPYSSQIPVSGAMGTVSWAIVSGILPPGMMLTQSGTVVGTPTVNGTYNFTIQASTPLGTFMQKPYSIVVLQITTTSLPGFTVGTPYSAQLQVVGGSGSYAWNISTGSLPDGLALVANGTISGTPTGATLGTNPIVFSVVDTSCEAAQEITIPPRVTLSTKSTSTVGQILGFNEYEGFVSNPPKRYRRITWTGSSEQQLWTLPSVISGYNYLLTDFYGALRFVQQTAFGYRASNGVTIGGGGLPFNGFWIIAINDSHNTIYTGPGPATTTPPAGTYNKFQGDPALPPAMVVSGPFAQPPINIPSVQFGGARYDYMGASEIDFQGNYLSFYTKNLSEMCNVADSEWTAFVANPTFVGGFEGFSFVGWIGQSGHNKCPLPGTPYTPFGNKAIGTGQGARWDNSFFWGSATKAPPSAVGLAPLLALSSTQSQCIDSGDGRTNSTPAGGRVVGINDPVAVDSALPATNFPAGIVWNHNFGAVMDEEFTEFDALSAGQTFSGSGNTAAYLRSGFTVQETTVNWTMIATNLIPQLSYLVTYELFNLTGGSVSTVQVGFVATATSHSISGTIPSPPSGQAIQIRNPKIIFSA